MNIRKIAKKSRIIRSIYYGLKRAKEEFARNPFNTDKPIELDGEYKFIDRSHGYNQLCIVLAGYKEPVWDIVFKRLKLALNTFNENIDVCIMTSGIENKVLQRVCEENKWSYLSTKENKLTLIQNIAIDLHKRANLIYKIDEDMFLPKEFFTIMKKTFLHIKDNSKYEIGFLGALTPINGFGYVRILEKLNLVDKWEKKFGRLYYSEGLHHHTTILDNPDAAKFMWGSDCEELRNIDKLTNRFKEEMSYSICPMRYSIGAVLFEKSSWLDWGMFPVNDSNGLGADEERMCYWAMFCTKAIFVAENLVVGHLGYGPQSKEMLDFFEMHKDWFDIEEDN